mgnify:CR=1 FL=1
MRMDKLTSKFQEALADAQSMALGRDHGFIESLHLMKALWEQDGGTAKPLLIQAGVQATHFKTALDEAIQKMPQVTGTGGEIHLSNELNRLLNMTDK